MDHSGAITDAAKALNEGRATYEGGAPQKAHEDERRRLMLLTPAEKFLDEQHFLDCIEGISTWAPDLLRQKMLRKLGGGQARGHVLRSDEIDALLAQVRDPLSK